MAVPFIKVNYTPPTGTESEITDFIRIDNQRGLELKSAIARFEVNNSQYRYKSGGESVFQEFGTFEVYADYEPITEATSQLLFSGQIKEIRPRFGSNGSTFQLTCADRTTVLLGGLWSKTYSDTVPNIIKNIVAQVGQNGDQIITTNNVVSTTVAGSSFPTIEYAQVFKPVVDWISDLSQPDYTGEDRAYMFYVDNENDLHWFYPSQTSDGTITEGTAEIYDINFTRNSDSITNMVIFNAGTDCNGNGTLWYYWDATTKSNTLKMKYVPMTDISKTVFDEEILAGNLDESSSGTFPYKGKLYVLSPTSGTTSWGEAYSDEADYKDKFRTRLKSLGSARAKTITNRLGKLLWNGKVELKGINDYTAGDLITFNLPTIGLNNYLLRIVDVGHSFGNDGWVTTLEIKEDEESVTATQVS